jgi:hypothetical protein
VNQGVSCQQEKQAAEKDPYADYTASLAVMNFGALPFLGRNVFDYRRE